MSILFSERVALDVILSKAHYSGLSKCLGVDLPVDCSWLRLDVTHYILTQPMWVECCGYRWEFDTGFITDLLSIPSKLTNLFPTNNLKKNLFSALVHDANFAFKLLPFEEANRVFYEMLRMEGMSSARATLFSTAVGSEIGREIYESNSPKDSIVRCKIKKATI